jgi:hypothetical protein
VGSIVLPFTLGVGLAFVLKDDYAEPGEFLPFALFLGASMSVTAFPVLARILTDRNMHRTQTGGLALACAAVDDVLAWTLLAVVIGIAGGTEESGLQAWLIVLAIPFAVFMLVVVRPGLGRLTQVHERVGRLTPGLLAAVLVGLLAASAVTELLHVHFIFGAFLFGAVMPREGAERLRHEILVRLEQISVVLLLPVFFLVSGLKVDLRGFDLTQVLILLLILAVAIVGKGLGAYLGARLTAVPRWQARSRCPDEHARTDRAGDPQCGPRQGADRRRAVLDAGGHGPGHDHDDRSTAAPDLSAEKVARDIAEAERLRLPRAAQGTGGGRRGRGADDASVRPGPRTCGRGTTGRRGPDQHAAVPDQPAGGGQWPD